MKHIYLYFLFITALVQAQIPSNYYDTATGTGYTLKTQLYNIVSTGHVDQGYGALYTAYQTTHNDDYYENDDSVLDFYSENPSGNDSYFYTHGNRQCGSYDSENDCYNREHLFPQGFFDQNYPMRSDVHHVIPSDGYVNNRRSNYQFGEVSSPTWTSNNGSKIGPNTFGSYSGTVFEPIDEFKGDIARALLYFAVRYENNWNDSGWDPHTDNNNPLNGTSDQFYEDWYIDLLLDWHANDPVVQAEIDRNNAAYNFQGNANPFVNHPEFVNMIWNPTADTQAPTAPTNLVASNPTDNTVDLNWTASTDNVAVTSYDIYVDGVNTFNTANTSFTATNLSANTNYCFTVKAKDAANNMSPFSNQDCEMTTNNGSGSSECINETFANIPASSSSYSNRNWTGDNGGSWSATDARTDQDINGSTAITIRNGSLTTPTVSGGIGSLTVTTLRVFSGSSGTFNLKVNGNVVGTIAYSDAEQTITVPNINVTGNISVVIDGNSTGSNRVIFDDLSWTCYAPLSTGTNELKRLSIYPNPVKDNAIYFNTNKAIDIKIYDILGKLVISKSVLPNSAYVDISNINKGIYLVKISSDNQSITKKLIRQ
ncbi:endonuclease [Flavobacteriaceae bacterium S0825]|uniref:endonuclease n=1 Tax=Gaetbulibacter sp. S0825 TaxID=2720084 RepID=UPI0014311C6C|nr:endonuclease [Gaetbulibacter sp. S0825]MCK0109301.1 endonuclease [Flavobacteriaceae bacterium S0825]NIX64935.1 T9SS type A sorting domain-containing protein [Gaetbulibacter sp. S0825]